MASYSCTSNESWRSNVPFLLLIVLQAYEVLLLFSREVDFIWKRKTTAVTVLYAIVRYGTILQVSLQLALNLWIPSSSSSTSRCMVLSYMDYVVDVLELVATAMFSFLRIWVVTRFGLYTPIPVLFLSLFAPCASIHGYTLQAPFQKLQSSPIPDFSSTVCGVVSSHRSPVQFGIVLYAARIATIISDILVLGTTWRKTIQTWRIARQLSTRSSLASVFLRDVGTVYFFTILGLNIFTLIFIVPFSRGIGTSSSKVSWVPYGQFSLTAILISRFLLDLRKVDSKLAGSNVAVASHPIHFASRVVGSIGASLEDSACSWNVNVSDAIFEEDPPPLSNAGSV